MNLDNLRAELSAWQRQSDLYDETSLAARAAALDFLDFVRTVVAQSHAPSAALAELVADAAQLANALTAVNQALFQEVRTAIRQQRLTGAAFHSYCNHFMGHPVRAIDDGLQSNYDGLDVLIDGLFALAEAPAPTHPLIAEMVHCEETPARVIFDLVDQIAFGPMDRFYDLGCGLGQVVMLVNLLRGVPAYGIEIEPAFVTFARQQATALALETVYFINADVQVADYQEGTVFFLFTPFRGQMMQQVLARLQTIAGVHPICVCTFGPCTPIMAQERWLQTRHPTPLHEYKLAIFDSL